MAFKVAVLLLGCALIAQSQTQTQCGKNDQPKRGTASRVVKMIESYVGVVQDYNNYVPGHIERTIQITSAVNLRTARSKGPQWLDSIKIIEVPPVTSADIQNCSQSDPREMVDRVKGLFIDDVKDCNSDHASSLRTAIHKLRADENRTNVIMAEARKVSADCQCQNECLSKLLPLAKEAQTLAMAVRYNLDRVKEATALNFVLNSNHCARIAGTWRTLQVGRYQGDYAHCIASRFQQ